MVTCSPGFVYFVGDNKQKTLDKIEPTMESKTKIPRFWNLFRKPGNNDKTKEQPAKQPNNPTATTNNPTTPPEPTSNKKACWRRVPPCLAFIAAFSTAMVLLLVWSQAAALRRQAFDVNLTKDYILANISMDNTQLIQYMREILLVKTTNKTSVNVTQSWEEKIVAELNQNKKDGVYLEYLSRTGESSTTAWLDRHLNWTGVIVITDPKTFSEAQKIPRNPKTRLLQACLSTDTETKEIRLPQESEVQVTKLAETPNSLPDDSLLARIMSFPLYSVLLAQNTTNLDYLSLDVQDLTDLQVLDTIPWDKVKISIIFIHLNGHHNEVNKKNVIDKLSNHSYKFFSPDSNKLIFHYNRQPKTKHASM